MQNIKKDLLDFNKILNEMSEDVDKVINGEFTTEDESFLKIGDLLISKVDELYERIDRYRENKDIWNDEYEALYMLNESIGKKITEKIESNFERFIKG